MFFSFGQLLIILADLLLVSTEQCKTGNFNVKPDKMDSKLFGYRFLAFENISPRGCFDKCIRRPKCSSYNFNRHFLRCELNYQPTSVSSKDFSNEGGNIYVTVDHYRGDPMYDTCHGNPCKNGEICERTNDGDVFCIQEHNDIFGDDCTELMKLNSTLESGVFTIYPSRNGEGTLVFCNMANNGWTVIQRRINGSENFNRSWIEYENGFGDLQHEFWLGNKKLNLLTSSGSYKLRVELVYTNNQIYYAEYSKFAVGDAATRYRLSINGYSGNAGDQMYYNNGYLFTTYDQDNDVSGVNCADNWGAWWHGSCSNVYLNNDFSNSLSLYWWYRSYIKSDMMIQRTT